MTIEGRQNDAIRRICNQIADLAKLVHGANAEIAKLRQQVKILTEQKDSATKGLHF